jgi:hypothetical protein
MPGNTNLQFGGLRRHTTLGGHAGGPNKNALVRLSYTGVNLRAHPHLSTGYVEFDMRLFVYVADLTSAAPDVNLVITRYNTGELPWMMTDDATLVSSRLLAGGIIPGMPSPINFEAVGGPQGFQQNLALPPIRMRPNVGFIGALPQMMNRHVGPDDVNNNNQGTTPTHQLNLRFLADNLASITAGVSPGAIGWLHWYNGNTRVHNFGNFNGASNRVPVFSGDVTLAGLPNFAQSIQIQSWQPQIFNYQTSNLPAPHGGTFRLANVQEVEAQLGQQGAVLETETVFTVRIEAPDSYTWQLGGVMGGGVANVAPPPLASGVPSSFNRMGGTSVTSTAMHNFNTSWYEGRHVLYVRVDVDAARAPGSFAPDVLDINGLWLHGDGRAAMHTIEITLQVGTSLRGGHPSASFRYVAGMAATESLVVGSQQNVGMELRALGTLPVVRAGYLGTLRSGSNTPYHRNPDNANHRHFRGVETATIRFAESIPGAWAIGWASELNFDFGPHVEILGADVHIFSINPGATLPAAPVQRNAAIIERTYLNFRAWANAENGNLPLDHTSVRFRGDGVISVSAPTRTQNQFNHRMAAEIILYLSIESDYAARTGTDNVQATLRGPALNNIERVGMDQDQFNNPLFTVARVRESISVSIPQGATQIATQGAIGAIANQRINDLVITVENPRDLRVNDEFWVYLAGEGGLRVWDVNISPAARLIYDTASGLALSPVRVLNHPNLPTGIMFQVHRAPHVTTPVDITVSNLAAVGLVLPGLNYSLVVSGSAVAQNNQDVRHTMPVSAGLVGLGGHGRRLSGVFSSTPFEVVALTSVQGTLPPDGDIQPPAPPQFTEVRFNANATTIGGVTNGFRWEIIPQNGHENRVGFINAEAFANLMDDSFSWNGTAVTGNCRATGIELVVTPAVSTAQINGSTYNIAEHTGLLPGSVSVIREGGNVFLPLRFFAEAFNFTVVMEGNIIIIS